MLIPVHKRGEPELQGQDAASWAPVRASALRELFPQSPLWPRQGRRGGHLTLAAGANQRLPPANWELAFESQSPPGLCRESEVCGVKARRGAEGRMKVGEGRRPVRGLVPVSFPSTSCFLTGVRLPVPPASLFHFMWVVFFVTKRCLRMEELVHACR